MRGAVLFPQGLRKNTYYARSCLTWRLWGVKERPGNMCYFLCPQLGGCTEGSPQLRYRHGLSSCQRQQEAKPCSVRTTQPLLSPSGPLASLLHFFLIHALAHFSFGYSLPFFGLTSNYFSATTSLSWEFCVFSSNIHLWPLLLFLH